MQQSKVVETWVGLFVVLGMVGLFFLAMKVSNLADLQVRDNGYRLFARFQNVGSLRVRSPVSMAGVRIGRVSSIRFDNKTYEAVVEMTIEGQYNTIPTDTTANILTAGLLGEQYVGLTAGGEEEYFKEGDNIELSQSALVLEEVISRFLFNKAESGAEKKDPTPVSALEDRAEPQPPLVEEAPAKSKHKPHDKSADSKHKPTAALPVVEKNESDAGHKPKSTQGKAIEETHPGSKAKGASSKEGEGKDAETKHKPVLR